MLRLFIAIADDVPNDLAIFNGDVIKILANRTTNAPKFTELMQKFRTAIHLYTDAKQ